MVYFTVDTQIAYYEVLCENALEKGCLKNRLEKNRETFKAFVREVCEDHNSLQNNGACEWEKVILKC